LRRGERRKLEQGILKKGQGSHCIGGGESIWGKGGTLGRAVLGLEGKKENRLSGLEGDLRGGEGAKKGQGEGKRKRVTEGMPIAAKRCRKYCGGKKEVRNAFPERSLSINKGRKGKSGNRGTKKKKRGPRQQMPGLKGKKVLGLRLVTPMCRCRERRESSAEKLGGASGECRTSLVQRGGKGP